MTTFSVSSIRTHLNVDRDSPEKDKYLHGDELERTRENPTEIEMEGVVYSAAHLKFQSLSKNALQNEEITTSLKSSGNESIVAFYSPFEKDEVVTMTLDNEMIGHLREKFGVKDLFEREDGIIRLNNDAQDYVSNWYYEIGYKRGYLQADQNGNGVIEESERGGLKVGFERLYDYGYLGEKVVKSHLGMSGNTYQSYSDTNNFRAEESGRDKSGLIYRQALKFEDTIESELKKTLENDRDLDGNITLEEGLLGEMDGDEGRLRQKILTEANKIHQNYLDALKEKGKPPPENKLIHRAADGMMINGKSELNEAFTSTPVTESKSSIALQNVDISKFRFLNGQKVSEVDPDSLRLGPIAFSPKVKSFEVMENQTDSWDDEAATHSNYRQIKFEYDLNARYINDPDRSIDPDDPGSAKSP